MVALKWPSRPIASETAGPRSQVLALAGRWFGLILLTLVGWALFGYVGLAAPVLFAALVSAIALALSGFGPARPPRIVGMFAQGTLAVAIGISVQPAMLDELGSQWLPIVTIAVATLVLSILAGIALSRHRLVDPVTGSLSMIAGGATGLVAVADELGADERVVVISQYLRVALVVLTMPLVVTYVFAADTTRQVAVHDAATVPWPIGGALTIAAIIIGTVVAKVLRVPIPATLGPLVLSGSVTLGNWLPGVTIPGAMLPVAFMVIGWQAGLAFTRAGILALGRIAGWAFTLTAVLIAGCAGLGALLSAWTGLSVMQGYLATTPGGLAAVLAVATSTDSDLTFIATSQILRLLVMLISAPGLVWLMRRWARPIRRT